MSELNFLKTDLEKIEYFYNLLRDRATGKSLNPYALKELEFIKLREFILTKDNYKEKAPKFLLKTRKLSDFWEFIKSDMPTYEERRNYLRNEFSELLNYIEFGDDCKKDKVEVIEYKSELKDEVEILKEDNKIFISHSSLDKDYAEELVYLLLSFGMEVDKILCTSVPGVQLELGEIDFLLKIKEHLKNSPLFICLFSKNYLASSICMAEMGAAWITSKNQRLILTPDTGFELSSNTVLGRSNGMKINEKHKVCQLIEQLQDMFKLPKKSMVESNILIERYIEKIDSITEKKKN